MKNFNLKSLYTSLGLFLIAALAYAFAPSVPTEVSGITAAFGIASIGRPRIGNATNQFITTGGFMHYNWMRDCLIRFESYLNGKGYAGSSKVTTPTDLRVEMELVPGQSTYNFDLKKGNISFPYASASEEYKLNSTSVFFVTHVALNVKKFSKVDTVLNNANYKLWTYNDENYFVGAATAAATEAQSLETIWQGRLSFKTNNFSRFTDIFTNKMKYVPADQFINLAVTGQVAHTYPSYGADYDQRGYHELHGNLILNGADDNIVTLNLGAGDTSAIAGDGTELGEGKDICNKLVLLIHGYEFTGAMDGAAKSCLI